ncbi:MAG: YeeE/YedE thiosulfate transporter family protein [Alphaproteobacteria bacterium]
MTIDWSQFSPLSAFSGGLLIGLAAAAFILLHGRIMGVSSILGGLIGSAKGDRGWRLSFLAGLIAAPILAKLVGFMPSVRIDQSLLGLVFAGLLVGFGTSLGNGCTSGHGVCGIARLSPRSIIATLTFMAFGMLTVWLMHRIQVAA